jgi:hypothetical protein
MMQLTPSVHYLVTKLAEVEAAMALMVEQAVAKDARIAELEKSRRKPRAAKPSQHGRQGVP